MSHDITTRIKRYYVVIFDQSTWRFEVFLIEILILIYTCFIELDRMWSGRRCRRFWQHVCFTRLDLYTEHHTNISHGYNQKLFARFPFLRYCHGEETWSWTVWYTEITTAKLSNGIDLGGVSLLAPLRMSKGSNAMRSLEF